MSPFSNSILGLFIAVTGYGVSVPAFKIAEKANYVYYPRESWGAQRASDVRLLETPVPFVVIHHTYIPGACFTTEDCKRDMRSMQTYHMGLGWGDIGYNFCVGTEGGVYEGRGWDVVGIHAGPANNYSIGICLIGDWRDEIPPVVTLEAAKSLISEGVEKGIISPDYSLIGHKQVMATECPGGALENYISTWEHFVPGHIDFKTLPKKGT